MGWLVEMHGDCEYHLSTTAGGNIDRYNVVGHVTKNDADEWVAFTGDVHAGKVIGSGYASLFDAKIAVDSHRCADCGTTFGRYTFEHDVCDVCVRMIMGLGPF